MKDFHRLDLKELPSLILGFRFNRSYKLSDYSLAQSQSWRNIKHEGLGYINYFIGIKLIPKDEVFDSMIKIDTKFYDSRMSKDILHLNDIIKYRTHLLETLDVDCDKSFYSLEEGVYPIDCSHANITKLSTTYVPKDLDSLIDWKVNPYAANNAYINWKLLILGNVNHVKVKEKTKQNVV